MSTVTRERPILQSAIALISALGLGFFGLALGFVLFVLVGAGIVFATGTQLPTFGALVLSLVFVQGVGCAGVALSYLKLRPAIAPPLREAFDIEGEAEPFGIPVAVPTLKQVGVVLAGYAGAIVWVMGSSIMLFALQQIRGQELDTGSNAAAEIGRSNPELLLLLIPASILIIGPGEELLFRGVVQARLRERFSPLPGIAIASAFFAVLHLVALVGGSLIGNLVVVSILFGTASVFGIAYEYADNIVVPSLIHGLYNATLFTLLYVSLKFSEELQQQQQALLGLA